MSIRFQNYIYYYRFLLSLVFDFSEHRQCFLGVFSPVGFSSFSITITQCCVHHHHSVISSLDVIITNCAALCDGSIVVVWIRTFGASEVLVFVWVLVLGFIYNLFVFILNETRVDGFFSCWLWFCVFYPTIRGCGGACI